MKIVCDFCKTEYTLTKLPGTTVKCAICGHVWTPHRKFVQNASFIKFMVVLCAFIAACIFSFVAIVKYQNNVKRQKRNIAFRPKNMYICTSENTTNPELSQ